MLSPGNLLDLTISVEISGPSGTPIDSTGDRVRVSETTNQTGGIFTHTLYFSPLSAGDEGQYTCSGIFHPVTPNPLVTNGTGSAMLNIIVIGNENCIQLYIAATLTVPTITITSPTVE